MKFIEVKPIHTSEQYRIIVNVSHIIRVKHDQGADNDIIWLYLINKKKPLVIKDMTMNQFLKLTSKIKKK